MPLDARYIRRRSSMWGGLSAGGIAPDYVLDFARGRYRANGLTQALLSDAVTHTATSPATMTNSSGEIVWGPNNLAIHSDVPATQDITVVSGADYTVECTGSGTVTLSGAGTGTVTEDNAVEVTASTTTLTLTVAGDVDLMWCYRSDLGGMAPIPANMRDLATSSTYVATTTTARYLPRVGHHIYDGTSWVDAGTRWESDAATNLFVQSIADSTTGLLGGSTTPTSSGWSNGISKAFEFPSGVGGYAYTNTSTTAQAYTVSCIAECGDGLEPEFGSATPSSGANDFCLILNSVVIDPTTYNTVNLGGGLYFVWGTATSAGGTGNNGALKYAANIADSVKVSAIQLETGSIATSLIPTNGTSATRDAETLVTPAGTAPWSGISNTTVTVGSDYTTGYTPTDTVLVAMASTDTDDLVAATPLDDDFTGYADQAAALSAGYVRGDANVSFNSGTDAWDFAAVAGTYVRYDGVGSARTVGKTYIIEVDFTGRTAGDISIRQGLSTTLVTSTDASGTLKTSVVENGDELDFRGSSTFDGSVTGVRIKLADEDRSTEANGLIINGTIAREPVTTGAEVVAYSGFSASNYLEQPYNADLDFGTGDFCVMGWFKILNVTTFGVMVETRNFGANEGFVAGITSSGEIFVETRAASAGSPVTGNAIVDDGIWHHFCWVVSDSGTSSEIYVDGSLDVSEAITARSIGSTSSPLYFGQSRLLTSEYWRGSLLFMRIAGSAPTAAEILEIYNREKVLFADTGAQISDMELPEVSISMKGTMTYADEDTLVNVRFLQWDSDAVGTYITSFLNTSGANVNQVRFYQDNLGALDTVNSSTTAYSPGINVPFSIASRHGTNFINAAVDRTALTANTTPITLPDLSSTDIQWGYDFNGTIESISVWDEGIGDTGIAEASE